MKKLWLRALTAATLIAGVSFGTVALAGDRHGGYGYDRGYDRHEYRHHNYHQQRHHKHHRHGYYRPYPVVREVYYAPAPRYYEPVPVYYGGRSGVSGSVTVHF